MKRDGQRPFPDEGPVDSNVEAEILRAVRAIRYGSIEIVIHDSRVVQIERREKLRINDADARGGS